MSSPLSADPRPGLRASLVCLALVLALKALVLAIDPQARIFLGDSGSYFHTALTGWIPPDRSFLYGWLVGAVALPLQSILALVLAQTGFGVLCAMLLFGWLHVGLGLRPAVAIAAAVAFALEPAQLFYERMMMAESAGLLAFVLYFIALSAHVAGGRLAWIPVYAVLGVLAVAFRISLMPVVLVLGLAAPLLRLGIGGNLRGTRAWIALSFILAAASTWYAHDAYKRWYGTLAESAPGYTKSVGAFRLGLVAPLVEPAHFRNSGVPPSVLDTLTIDLRDPRMREAHIWMEGGLVRAVKSHSADPESAARKISIKAARDDPFGLARIGLMTVADYFEPSIATPRLLDDIGTRAPDEGLVRDLRSHLRFDASRVHLERGPVTRLFVATAPWLTACLFLLAPLALLALVLGWRLPRRELRLLIALCSFGLVAAHVLFSHIVSFRYLHPLPWFVLANLAVLVQIAWSRRLIRRAEAYAGTPTIVNSRS
jgi:hypothetical protein